MSAQLSSLPKQVFAKTSKQNISTKNLITHEIETFPKSRRIFKCKTETLTNLIDVVDYRNLGLEKENLDTSASLTSDSK